MYPQNCNTKVIKKLFMCTVCTRTYDHTHDTAWNLKSSYTQIHCVTATTKLFESLHKNRACHGWMRQYVYGLCAETYTASPVHNRLGLSWRFIFWDSVKQLGNYLKQYKPSLCLCSVWGWQSDQLDHSQDCSLVS